MQSSITVSELLKIVKCGDIGLSENPDNLGKIINAIQCLDGDDSIYTHAFYIGASIFQKNHLIYEAYKYLTLNPIENYIGKKILIMRHKKMSKKAYLDGQHEIIDNIGQRYPYYRLLFFGFDSIINFFLRKLRLKCRSKITKKFNIDHPVCSEYVIQPLEAAGLDTGFESSSGVNPDDLHDKARERSDLWEVIFEGILKK